MTNFKSHVDKDNNLMAIAIIKELSLYKMNLQKSIRREIINCDNKALRFIDESSPLRDEIEERE